MGPFGGVIVPMITCYEEGDPHSIDLDATAQLTEWLCSTRVSALFPVSGMGQWRRLDMGEKAEIIRMVIDTARGRKPVLAGVGSAKSTEETITLKYGFMDIVRTIHMNLEEHPVDITPTRAGHSIGRWEDDVLVVDTIGFAEGFIVVGREGVVKHSNALHSVERFSYDAATQALNRSHVVEDPLYFNGQFTGQRAVYLSDVPFNPYDCVELKDEDLQD